MAHDKILYRNPDKIEGIYFLFNIHAFLFNENNSIMNILMANKKRDRNLILNAFKYLLSFNDIIYELENTSYADAQVLGGKCV